MSVSNSYLSSVLLVNIEGVLPAFGVSPELDALFEFLVITFEALKEFIEFAANILIRKYYWRQK